MIRKAFYLAQAERPGAVYLAIPEDVEAEEIGNEITPLIARSPHSSGPDLSQAEAAAELISKARYPVILAGHGVVRNQASDALCDFAGHLNLPIATTFMAKGAISDRNANSLGVVGFMQHDYANFAFDRADLIISIGYELQEFAPKRINPQMDKKIIHIHRFAADVDAAYQPSVSIEADIIASRNMIWPRVTRAAKLDSFQDHIRSLSSKEIENGDADFSFPLKPQRIVADIRSAMADEDIVLADTGATKMWMARIYRTYAPLTCIFSNGLSTMAFALPGAIGAKLAFPDRKVLAVMGDGSFLMNSQEIETALRERISFVVLVWVDNSYGLIKWKMDLELGQHNSVDFRNPDLVAYAQSFGAKGYQIRAASELLPTLQKALNDDTVSIIACPVDYSENKRLTDRLGKFTMPL